MIRTTETNALPLISTVVKSGCIFSGGNSRYRLIIRSKQIEELFDRPLINNAIQLLQDLKEKYDGGNELPRLYLLKRRTLA